MSNRELSPSVEVVSQPREPEHLALLRTAKATLADASVWCKGKFMRYEIDEGPAYTQFCMMGALGDNGRRILTPAQQAASHSLYNVADCTVTDFNDDPSTTHADVMAAFDLAIEQATKDWLVAK